METYSSNVGSAIHKVPPSNSVLTMNIVDSLRVALKSTFLELREEREQVVP